VEKRETERDNMTEKYKSSRKSFMEERRRKKLERKRKEGRKRDWRER
jgi:hypothetical protein